MSDAKVELVADCKARIGEGPSWDARKKVLYWVDIPNGHVHVYDARKRSGSTISLGGFVSSVVPSTKVEVLVVTVQHGFYKLDERTSKSSKIAEVELDLPNNRFNDGKCDPRGRFWAGTMDINEKVPSGSLYRLDGTQLAKMESGATVSNGLGWSPDNSTMYYIDSPLKRMFAFDYDIDKGTIKGRRTLVDFASEEGSPDGMAVDEEGMLWVAHWGGYMVSRWDPKTRRRLGQIPVPAPNVASCCFGGDRLDELYITTATEGLSNALLRHYPKSGGLFRARCGVRGLPTNLFQW